MTLFQLETLTEEEIALCLYIVNFVLPTELPKMEYTPRQLTWFRHDMLIQKLVSAFPKLKEEGHPTFVSLMEKLGVKGEIRKPTPQPETSSLCQTLTENTSSCEPSMSIETELPST